MHRQDIYSGEMNFRAAEAGPYGDVHLFHVANILQDAAGRHADMLGFGMSTLHSEGVTWALTQMRIQLDEPLIPTINYQIQTWPAGSDGLRAFRRFRILHEGRECGRAHSTWLLLQEKSHRPVRLPVHLTDREWPEPPALPTVWQEFNQTFRTKRISEPQKVRHTELDINRHVNNAHYLGWALDAMSETLHENWVAVACELNFLAEMKPGDSFRVHTDVETEQHVAANTSERVTKTEIENLRFEKPSAKIFLRWKPRNSDTDTQAFEANI